MLKQLILFEADHDLLDTWDESDDDLNEEDRKLLFCEEDFEILQNLRNSSNIKRI